MRTASDFVNHWYYWTVTINNEPYFVGKDVADILGYSKSRNAIALHVDEDDALKQGITDNLGRMQETIIINESFPHVSKETCLHGYNIMKKIS